MKNTHKLWMEIGTFYSPGNIWNCGKVITVHCLSELIQIFWRDTITTFIIFVLSIIRKSVFSLSFHLISCLLRMLVINAITGEWSAIKGLDEIRKGTPVSACQSWWSNITIEIDCYFYFLRNVWIIWIIFCLFSQSWSNQTNRIDTSTRRQSHIL